MATEVETSIEADHLEYDEARQVYRLRGNVRIERLDAVIEAEKVDYMERDGEARASGRVRYEDRWVLIEAEKADINLETKRGVIYNAHMLFKEDNYHIRAEEIERIDEKNYIIKKVLFTTCDAPLPEWCFSAGKTEIRVGESLRARNVVFRIKGIPVLFSPYLFAPIQTERKTGLLQPEVGFGSDKGFFWRQPLFLVLSDNRDATLYLDFFAKRGVGEGLEYRYIERRAGAGKWWLYHLRDRELGKDFFELKGRHTLFRKDGLSGFLNIDYINDRIFYQEYSHRVELRVRKFLESTGELSYPFRRGRFYILARAWQDLSEEDSTGDLLQKVPEIGLSFYPQRRGPFYLSMKTAVTNFYSENLHRVQRLDIYPRAYHSTGDSIQLSQTLGVRGTLYSISNSDEFPDTIGRASFDYNIRAHTRFLKRYPNFTHIIEPEIGYSFIPRTDGNIPLLDNTELYDRVSKIEVGLRNYLFDSRGQIASMRLTESYDFHSGDRPFGLIRLEAVLLRPLRIELDTSYNPNSGDFERINYSTSLRIGEVGLSLGQRYSREDDILFYTGALSLPLTRKWALNSSIWYDARGEGLKDLNISTLYSAQCWGINITYNKRPDEYSVFFIIELKGLGAIKFTGI